ncbi:hypothetical protein CABS01_16258 [Colletotrichum abscissum]|uniref:uncharacterized protein n=1 Tax=Colletotrichum abscissum TaxID=1671311 RepID=UPI0027D54C30|nr:uncharacterized protein CABS01_16258 [Colletotrichum abscissum]KAK1472584.1 hypothetical protein CABS01_16258 [Colletotrichum abscissum]
MSGTNGGVPTYIQTNTCTKNSNKPIHLAFLWYPSETPNIFRQRLATQKPHIPLTNKNSNVNRKVA